MEQKAMGTVKGFLTLFSTLLLGWLPVPALSADSGPAILDANLSVVDPSPALTYLLDPTGTLTLADVRSQPFRPLENGVVNFGFTTDKIWLHVAIQNVSGVPITPLLQTSARFMRPLEVFLVRQDGTTEQLLYNDETQAFGERPLPELRFLATQFSLAPGELADLYVRFGAGGQAAMTLQLASREHALTEQFRASLGITVYAAILLTLVMVNFFHYLAVRKLAYLVYVFYESFNVLYVAHMEGFTFQYLWPNLPQWNDDATPMIAALGIIIGNYFAMVFLETRKHTPRLHWIFLGMIVIAAVVLAITVVAGNSIGNQLTAPMLPLSLLLSVIAAAIALRHGHYLARYFLVAWSMFAVVGAIWSGTVLGLFDASYNVLTIYKMAIAAQAIILSMGLADQVRRINNEYTRTQRELIDNLEGRLEDARERLRLEHENENTVMQLLEKSRKHAATSHDINQPIQSLRLALGALRHKADPQATAHLEKILDHMQSVLGGALSEASEELKQTNEQSAIRSLVAGRVITDVVSQLQERASAKHLALRGFNSKAVFVGREVPLKRCLLNLVTNAIDNTMQGGILIGARRRGNDLLFQVYDTGKGIPAEDTENILQPLHKGIDSRGHGLGLAIISDICREYGWHFTIRSKLHRGSCFTVAVPIRA